MAEASDIEQRIIDSAADGIQSVIVDGDRVDAKPISELIAADNYAASKSAVTNPSFGIRFTQLVPPGSL